MNNYPKFYEYGGYNKLTSKDDGISVVDDRQELCVQVLRGSFPSSVIEKNGKTITASVFENCLQSALTKLNALVQKEEKRYTIHNLPPNMNRENERSDVFNQLADIVRPEKEVRIHDIDNGTVYNSVEEFLGNDADDIKDVNI